MQKLGLLVFVFVAVALSLSISSPLFADTVPGTPNSAAADALATASDPVVVFTSDSSTGCNSSAASVAKLLDTLPSSWPILFSGDSTETGAYTEFTNCFNTTYGRHKAQIRPVPGNGEYHTAGAAGFFKYFGAQAGPSGKGYYSFNVGTWHIIALNSQTSASVGSAQEQWLKSDLAANSNKCTLAFWHKPRFSAGPHGDDTSVGAFWTDLYNGNAEIVLNGHDHTYQRFAPQNPSGSADSVRGIREFVVGLGGDRLYDFKTTAKNSQVRNNTTWGALQLTLHAGSYDWKFLPVAGSSFTDSGTTACH